VNHFHGEKLEDGGFKISQRMRRFLRYGLPFTFLTVEGMSCGLYVYFIVSLAPLFMTRNVKVSR
jgi:hypothetical protein